MNALRLVTWLAPGISEGFFRLVAEHLGRAAALEGGWDLRVEARHSGPLSAHEDVFADGAADVGFLCAPSYLWLRQRQPPSVVLLPAALEPDDPRAQGRPVYFSEVVVRRDDPAKRFLELAGRPFVYNDDSSLSGYHGLWKHVVDAGWDASFFGSLECTGSHRASLAAVVDGTADAAAIDANVLRAWTAERPDVAARLRVVASLGPFPVQPVVLRADLVDTLRAPLAAALVAIPPAELAPFGVRRFHATDGGAYEEELELLHLPERLPTGTVWLERY